MGWKNWRGNELLSIVDAVGRQAVRDTCEEVLKAAKQEVPHDEGALMRSGRAIMAPEGPAGVICFGGGPGTGLPIIPYAVRWHEGHRRGHPQDKPPAFQKGRKTRYLADPVNRLGEPTLKNALEQALGGVLR